MDITCAHIFGKEHMEIAREQIDKLQHNIWWYLDMCKYPEDILKLTAPEKLHQVLAEKRRSNALDVIRKVISTHMTILFNITKGHAPFDESVVNNLGHMEVQKFADVVRKIKAHSLANDRVSWNDKCLAYSVVIYNLVIEFTLIAKMSLDPLPSAADASTPPLTDSKTTPRKSKISKKNGHDSVDTVD